MLMLSKEKYFMIKLVTFYPYKLDEMSFIKCYEKLVLYSMAFRFLEKIKLFYKFGSRLQKIN